MCDNVKNWLASKKWGQIFTDFSILLVMTLLPTILLLFWAGLSSQFIKVFNTCYTAGEFLLYSVALMTSAFVVLRAYKSNVVWISVSLCFVAGFYAIVMIVSRTEQLHESTNNSVTFWVSAGSFAIAMIECFISLCIQHRKLPDARDNNQNVQIKIQEHLQ